VNFSLVNCKTSAEQIQVLLSLKEELRLCRAGPERFSSAVFQISPAKKGDLTKKKRNLPSRDGD